MHELKDLTAEMIRFRDERNRAPFRTPGNLAVAVAITVAGTELPALAPF